jgi:acetyl esterase
MPLHPEAVDFLAAAKSAGAVDISTLTPRQARSNSHIVLDVIGTIDDRVKISQAYMTGPTADIPLEIYTPPGEGPFNGLVWFHGGGWVLNYVISARAHLAELAIRTQSVVVAVNYQKAPEHKFPIPHDDCYEGLLWTVNNAHELNIDIKKIGVGGDSAGGNLASGVALRVRDEGNLQLAYQMLVYPCNGLDFNTPSYLQNAEGFGLSRAGMMWLWEQYLNGPTDHENPYAVPLSSKNTSGCAPAIIATAEFDVLRDDGLLYAELLRSHGVDVIYKNFDGLIHGAYSYTGVIPSALVMREFFGDSINAILATIG